MGSVVVVTAPSGCGKSTLINAYMKANQNASFVISHTTRAVRGSEQDGVEYHFIDVQTFKQMISNHEFVEWAEVHGNYYGTSKKELENVGDGKILILDIDVQGAVTLQRINVEALFIFIKPPSIEDLKNRLVGRNTDNEDVIQKRLWNARRELENEHLFHTVIVNAELDKAQKEFDEAISNYQNRVVETVAVEPKSVSVAESNNDDDVATTTIENVETASESLDSESAVAENLEANSESQDAEEESMAADSLDTDDNDTNKSIETDISQDESESESGEIEADNNIESVDEAVDAQDENKELNSEGEII